MVIVPILVFSDWKKDFHVHVYASYILLGAMLIQPGKEDIDHPIAFASRKLSKVEKSYSTIGCEGLEMVYAVQKSQHYLLAVQLKMYTDHFALKYQVNKPVLGGGGDFQMVAAIWGVWFWGDREARIPKLWY